MRKDQKGFTLMELMVVIVIVAILAAVAVPLYINYVKDAQRTEAKGAIGAVITAEQAYYQANGTYTSDPTQLNVDLSDIAFNWGTPVITASATSFDVQLTGTGKAAGLMVGCNYTKGAAPVWRDETTTGP